MRAAEIDDSMAAKRKRGPFPLAQCVLYLMACGALFLLLDLTWRWQDLRLALSGLEWVTNIASMGVVVTLAAGCLGSLVWLVEKGLARLPLYPPGAFCHAASFLFCLYVGSSYCKFILGLSRPMRPLVLQTLAVDGILLLAYLVSRAILWKSGEPTERFPHPLPKLAAGLAGGCFLLSTGAAVFHRGGAPSVAAATPTVSQQRPHILWLSFDSLSADYMSLYQGSWTGSERKYPFDRPTTPVLDKLASQSCVFLNAMTNVTQTRYAVASLLGRSPQLETPPRPCLGDVLDQAGYRQRDFISFSVFSSALRDSFTRIHRYDRSMGKPGFRKLADLLGSPNVVWLGRLASEDIRFFSLVGLIHPADLMAVEYDYAPPGPLMDKTLEVLSEAPDPAFVWAHVYQPHSPYNPEPGFDFSMGQETQLRKYASVVADIDRRVGLLIEQLKQRGLYERTLIVITADHGEHFEEGRSYGHGGDWLSQDMVSVPLLIHFPGQTESVRVEATTQHLDLAPTLLEFLGIPRPEWLDGQSLMPFLTRPLERSDRVIVCAPGSRFWRSDHDLSEVTYPWRTADREEYYAFTGDYRVEWTQKYKRDPKDPRKVVELDGFVLNGVVNVATDPSGKNLLEALSGPDGKVRPTGELKAVLDRVFANPTVRGYLTSAPWIGPQLGVGLGH